MSDFTIACMLVQGLIILALGVYLNDLPSRVVGVILASIAVGFFIAEHLVITGHLAY